MNVLLRATICDNLSDKNNKKKIHWCLSSVSATFNIDTQRSWPPIGPHTACDYLHPLEIKTQVSQINVTDC